MVNVDKAARCPSKETCSDFFSKQNFTFSEHFYLFTISKVIVKGKLFLQAVDHP